MAAVRAPTTRAPTVTKAVLAKRAVEAAALLDRLIDSGASPGDIATEVQVSERTVYRWWREGHAPHPVMLEAIRRLAAAKGL